MYHPCSHSVALSLWLPLIITGGLRSAEINASDFESLQAAADAIPESGGVLRIPAGHYEIDEPLRIKTGDTLIVGSGSATHIVNHNASGRPAILIEHPESITGNTFTIVKNVGLSVGPKSGSINITGNNFSDSWIGRDELGKDVQKRPSEASKTEANPNEAAGIVLDACQSLVISGNLFSRLASEPIVQLGSCRDILTMANGARLAESK